MDVATLQSICGRAPDRKVTTRSQEDHMPFTLPKFINNLDRWVNPNRPSAGPPDYTNQPYQIYTWSRQANYWFDSTSGRYFPTIIIREPPSPSQDTQPGDVIGKDVAFTAYPLLYVVLFKTIIHPGFPNAYRQLYCAQCGRNRALLVNPFP